MVEIMLARKSVLLGFLILAQIFLVSGCIGNYQQVEQEALRERTQIRGYKPPQNYKELINARFVQILKDPDSRKIEYTSTPYGSLICGTINAKNSYGGYTGQQPFYAYFGVNGNLADLESFSDRDVHTLRGMLKINVTTSLLKARLLLEDCGFL